MAWRDLRGHIRIPLAAGLCLVWGLDAHAQAFLEDAQLVDVRIGKSSYDVSSLAGGRGILSDGSEYTFRKWYEADFPDLRLTMITPISDTFGVYWGFGTGESGEKYFIDPSVKVGFLATQPVGSNGLISLSVSFVLGGYLRERSCSADYGAIGGVQDVNCRLAGAAIPPKDTLDYLLNERPSDQVAVALRYVLRF